MTVLVKTAFLVFGVISFGGKRNQVEGCGGCGPSPRHGQWCPWNPASWEETPCSNGYKTRSRNCDNPAPAHGGRECSGNRYISIDCIECNYDNGGCEHLCVNYDGTYSCRCHPGYKISTGNWKKCDRITCDISEWPTPSNGQISAPCAGLSQVVSGTSCEVTCDDGYELSGSSSSVCGIDGEWDPRTTANCKVSECPPLTEPDNGQITPYICKTKPLHGQTCQYECRPGFRVIGPSSSKCDDGHWTHKGIYCQDYERPSFGETCPSARSVFADEGKASATISWEPVIATDNDQAIVTVSPPVTSPHIFSEGSHSVTYTATDPSGNVQLCHFQVTVQVLRCPVLFIPANGRLENTACGNLYGSTCRLTCNKGYEIKGSEERKCDKKTGTSVLHWTGNDTYCEALQCPALDNPDNTVKSGYGCTGVSSTYGTSCFFTCMTGYYMVSGSQKRTCLQTGMWSGTQLRCEAITCPPFSIKSKELIISPAFCTNATAVIHHKSECWFSCKNGYQQSGPGVKTCNQNNDWSPLGNPSCKDVSAPVFAGCPSNIFVTADRGETSAHVTWAHPTVTDNSGLVPNITQFGKQPGSRFSAGEHNKRYLASDRTGNIAECRFKIFVQVLRCLPKLQAPAGGSSLCTKGNQYGSECSFTCHIGHKMIGSTLRVCEKDPLTSLGFWTGNETKCELIRCPRLNSSTHITQYGCGRGSLDNSYGDKCLLYCDVGYRRVNGSTERICQADGTWSGEEPYCEAVRCKSLQTPIDGDITPSSCTSSPKYYTTCLFSCRNGYRLHGEPIATCLGDGRWSKNVTAMCKDVESPSFGLTCPSDIKTYADKGKNYTQVSWPPVIATDNSGLAPNVTSRGVQGIYYSGKYEVSYNASDGAGNFKICKFHISVEVLRCQTLLPPLEGSFSGDCDNIYGSTCKVACKDGYNLDGSSILTCLRKPGHITGYWNGSFPVCQARRCLSLSTPQYGFIYPRMCKSSPVSRTACYFECRNGFHENGGETVVYCGNDGKWSKNISSILKCLDVSPPVFRNCPSDIRVNLNANSTAMANWTVPVALDDSNVVPQVTVYPHGIKPPHVINETLFVEYKAKDPSGNVAKCSFRIIPEDNSGPVVVFCPSSRNITSDNRQKVVTWPDPQFKDNSNGPLHITCNRKSGTVFYWGSYTIHCMAYDNNPENEPAVCKFDLTIRPKECKDLKAPINGAKACDDWIFGTMCTPSCNSRYDFSDPLRVSVWACGGSGTWFPPKRWPDCTIKFHPNRVIMAMELHYYDGDCNTEETRTQIQQLFIKILNGSVRYSQACQDPSVRDKCKAENVVVTCGEIDESVGNRKKRSIGDNKHFRERRSIPQTRVAVEIIVELDGIEGNDTDEGQIMIGEEGVKIAYNIGSLIKQAAQNGSFRFTVNGSEFVPDIKSLNISTPQRLCNKGQIYRNGFCLNCSSGTFLNKTTEKCQDCPHGAFQDSEGQEQCLPCPPGTSTIESRTANRSSCFAFCKAGSYSPTGLEPCFPCDKGSYQEVDGKKYCSQCAVNQTTTSEGSNSSMLCGEPCPPGSFSSTGLAPCSLCDQRSFQPRNESRICFSCPGTTVTVFPGSKTAQDCIEINECKSDPCSNNATCTDLIGDYLCSCTYGYTGKQCETNIDECQDQPCFNNGTCPDLVNNYTCTCAQGFRGNNCEEDINECDSLSCANNASCQNLPGGYKCQCKPGYSGALCDIDSDDCLIFPCQNGGTCRDGFNNYKCICVLGYQGDNCQENIDDCAGNSCQNGGQCIDGIGSYQCFCPKGFTGSNCDIDIDECVTADCKNNATCIDEINGYFCKCEQGFSGKTCETDIDECFSNPCKNQAHCVNMVNAYKCDCQDGFDGLHCENNIDDCATGPCSNNGSCHDGINNFTCVCPPGFTGELCNIAIDYCASKPCFNNGSCLDDTKSFTCQCVDGFKGERCEINVDNCKNATCMNNSTCIDGIGKYECACAEGFVGIDCEINVDDCAGNPCVNDGTCTDLVNDYQCNCKLGYTGKNCSVNINDCASSPCNNNATCVDQLHSYTCICNDGFSGTKCEVDIDECAVNYCKNGSTCKDEVNGYSCECTPGFSGDDCSTEIDECASFPCDYGGTCFDQLNAFLWVCKPGFTGQRCDMNIDECVSSPCQNNGTCLDRVLNYTCKCPVGFNGFHCENPVDYCSESGNCTVNGHCVNSRTDSYCNCSTGYFGKYCEFEIDECLARPCFNNATCHDAIGDFSCSCLDGYTGRLCELNVDDCGNNSCQNNATCIDRNQGYSCLCSEGYNGTYCQTEVNECESSPCLNNGSCIDLTPGYKCDCFDKFIGENCENLTDLCLSAPCENGGTCKTESGGEFFSCTCPAGFTGSTCEVNINDCVSNPCTPNSYCQDQVNGYTCECYPSFTGDRCDIFLGSNFDLIFRRKSKDDMVLLSDGKSVPSMRSFTIALFVRADPRYKSGTLFSYSVPQQPRDKIILSFTESQIILEIKDDVIKTNFELPDDHWHYVGVVWNGITVETFVYVDGPEVKHSMDAKTGSTIMGGGWIVLGQRYLAEEQTPTESTAFVGTLHQASFWDVPASADHMWNAAHSCTWPVAGSVRAWSSFLLGIKGEVEKKFMTQCKALENCTTNCSHFFHCEAREVRYHCTCQLGFSGTHCNIDINDCSSNPCINGKCVDGVNRYDCECHDGYYGTNCEHKIVEEKVCPKLEKPRNGQTKCRKLSGKLLCIMSCVEGHAFNSGATTMYGCGPDTEWKWNGKDDLEIPSCTSKAAPTDIEHHFSIKFLGINCRNIKNHNDLLKAVKSAVNKTLSTVSRWHACQLTKLTVPGCELPEENKKKRAVTYAMEVLFSLMVREALDSNSVNDDVTEKSEAVLFQMKYAVATGQFIINMNGMNITAERSSLQHLSSSVICNAGFVTSSDEKGCVACPVGTYYNQNSFNCTLCGKGSYQDKEGQSSCEQCEQGKSTNVNGAISSKDCVREPVSIEEGTSIGAIVGATVAVVILIPLVVFFLYRRFTGKPEPSNESITYSQQGVGNPGFLMEDRNMTVTERRNGPREEHSENQSPPPTYTNYVSPYAVTDLVYSRIV
ncbi:sushi, von Willebrand factor type A, EGF and pentraxin domain-containing protein 1-like isoform X2 [Stylophora pistillata]|uniref:Fibropellin-1 n=1 Tax=Stylophora pistillata TaxID=50429 RepID=A0A2B4S3F6_STYPI|nr:sushi, von Willebrand factor type A, EGF and pentraxin domain-containing protein 1-like isoform X2 [Stylophora pistillata]PFX23098.1 Fibropellin-1 [Stylophora pistillata]